MARKSKRRGDAAATEAPVEVAEQEALAAASVLASLGKTGIRRGGHATAEQEASAAVHALGPADSGKGTTDGEGEKPRLNKQKRNKTDQTPCLPASNADAAATGKSGDDCTDVVGVLGDAEVSMNPRNGDDPDCPQVNIGEKGTPERKKPNREKGKKKKKKKNMQKQQLSPSAVSDVEVDKPRTDCKDVEDVPGDDDTIRSLRNEEDPGFSAVKIAEQVLPERKKPRHKKRKINKQEQSPSDVTDGNTVVVGTSGNDSTHGKGVPGVVDVSMSSRNGEYQDCPEVNIAEKETPQRKNPKLKKPKDHKQERSPAVVSDEGAVQLHKSVNVCIDGDAASGDAQVSMSIRNVEHPYCPEVNIAEKETNERTKLKPKKRRNENEGSSSVVLNAGAVVADESRNGCTDRDGLPHDIDASICPRNGEDTDCPAVKNAEKETPQRKKPKFKKPKDNKQERSPAVVSDEGAVQLHKSVNVCIDGDAALGVAQVSMSARNVEHPYCPEVNIAEKEANERKKLKPKKRKNKNEGSSSVVLDAGAVVADESRHSCTDGDGLPHDIDASICPRNGEDTDCPAVKNAEKETPQRKKPKLKKPKENKQERSPAVVSDEGAVQLHRSVDVCIDGDAASGDAQVSMSTRNVEHPYCPEVNIAEKEANETKKLKPKKRKNKNEGSSSVVLDAGAVVADESRHGCTDGDGLPHDIDASICPRNGEDTDCPAVKNAEKETPQMKKPKLKKPKENKQEQSPAVVSDEGAVQLHKSVDVCIDGDAAGGDAQVSMSTRNIEHPYCPEVNIAEKEANERKKIKPKKRKNKNKGSSSVVLDAGVVLADESRHGCTDGDGLPHDIDASICPRNGEDTNCPAVKNAEKEKPQRKKPKLKKPKENKQERSPAVVSDEGAVQLHKSVDVCIDGDSASGDAQVSMSARNVEHPYCPEVNIAEKEANERKKLKPKKRKNKNEGSSSVVQDAGAVVADESRNGCTDGYGLPHDIDASICPRNGEDTDCPAVKNAEKETPQRKKPMFKKPKENKQERSPAVVSDESAVQLHKSVNVCIDGDAASGDAQVSMSTRNVEHPYCPEVNIAEKETHVRKKPKTKKRKNKNEGSSSVVLDAGAIVADESRHGCTDGDGLPHDIDASICPRNGEDTDGPALKNAEKETPQRKKPKFKKPKENKQERSPAVVSDEGAVQLHKSVNVCIDGDAAPGDAQVSMSTRNVEHPYCPEVNIAEKETNVRKKPKPKKRKNKNEGSSSVVLDAGAVVADESRNGCTDGDGLPHDIDASICPRNGEDTDCPAVKNAEKETPQRKKPKLKKPKENKQERSPAVVSDDGAVKLHKSVNVCIDGDAASGDAQVSMSARNVEHPYCPEVNIAEKETNERKKPKPKKRKNKKEGSSSVVQDAGAVVADESRNGCTDGDVLPHDIDASICPTNGEDPDCPEVKNAEKGVPEMYKPKRKKQKKNQEQSPSPPVLDAGDVVMDKSGHDSTNLGAQSGVADVTISPRVGEGPEYSKLNTTDDLLEGNKVKKGDSQKSKLKKQMTNKHEQSPSAVPDTCAVVEDKCGKSYIDGKGSLGDTEISTSPRTANDRNCPEVNMANDLVEGKHGNNDNSQKIETPPVGDVSSDERKVVCRTGSMKVTAKPDIISMTSSSGENHKENVRDFYSPEGSLVRFQRKKLLILDLNGILADINTDSNVSHLADGRIGGKHRKNVFKRNYLDDFLRFCFQNFELGIWSSRMKVNVDAVVDILMKDLRRHLVFCWDISQCTTTKWYTLENYRKPLVLKELKKLWNKEDPDLPWEQGEFSPSNTLLVDDSPYKALRNPPHTAIFPQTYSYHMKDDESLGPGGDLRVYLENLAAADDVQRYVQEHPFGQPPITESDPHWDFYAKIQ